jgi:hypothetical protein
MLWMPAGRWAACHAVIFGASKQPSSDAPEMSSETFHRATCLLVKRGGLYLSYSQMLQHLLHEPILEVPALFAV